MTAVRRLLSGQVIRFMLVGAGSTVAYLGLYTLLRVGVPPVWANLGALLATTVANTAVNRRVTFGVRGRRDAGRHQIQGLIVFLVALGLSDGALALLRAADAHPARWVELAALIVANVLSTALRFLVLRIWVFRHGWSPVPVCPTTPEKA